MLEGKSATSLELEGGKVLATVTGKNNFLGGVLWQH
jgi:hypothetical protein